MSARDEIDIAFMEIALEQAVSRKAKVKFLLVRCWFKVTKYWQDATTAQSQ